MASLTWNVFYRVCSDPSEFLNLKRLFVHSMFLNTLLALYIGHISGLLAGSTVKCGFGPLWNSDNIGRSYHDVHCVFHNVCWHQNALLFNITESQSWGKWPILVSGSSVPDHEGLTIDIIPVQKHTLDYIEGSTNIGFTERAILLKRFLPSNLFHVLHDDILPVFALKESLSQINLSLFFTDGKIHRFDTFYSLLGLPLEYAQPEVLKCFGQLFVGLPKTTLWYQYGFKIPQGGLFSTDHSTLRRFTNVLKIRERLRARRTCTILMRRYNRRILNLKEVEVLMQKKYNCLLRKVSLDLSIEELHAIISTTDLLISMHGAELSLVIFLPAHAAVIELFPYAINSSNYTPYRRLCGLLGLVYDSWENPHKAKSSSDPEKWLSSLSPQRRIEVLEESTIKPHLCCTDPAWLFRIYQDTTVDIESLEKVLRTSTLKQSNHNKCRKKRYSELLNDLASSCLEKDLGSVSVREEWRSFWNFLMLHDFNRIPSYYPGPVRNIRCFKKSGEYMILTWRPPINYGDAFKNESRHFEVITQCGSEVLMTLTKETSFVSSPCEESVTVWVQVKGGVKATYPSMCRL